MPPKITHLPLIIALFLIPILESAASAQAVSLTVCPVGCTHATIGAAITAAASGDDIFIGPGTYNENITFDQNVKLIGSGAASTIIQGDNTVSVIIINAGVTVTISGVTIENGAGNITLPSGLPASPTDQSGRRVGGGIDNNGTLWLSHSIVQNNVVIGENAELGRSSRYSALGGGIYNAAGANLTVTHSTIANNRAVGGRGVQGGGGAVVSAAVFLMLPEQH